MAFRLIVFLALSSQAVAGTIDIQISNFPNWSDFSGVRPRSVLGLSALQRMSALSQPYIRIKNDSLSPLVGFQMDMSNWSSMITSVTWMAPLPTVSTWNWDESSRSAFFQLRDSLLPGQALFLRLGTAAQTGKAGSYYMNQTLLSPGDISCVIQPTGGAVFDLFANTGSGPVYYDSSGKAVGPTISTGVLDLQNYPVTPETLMSSSGTVADVVVPVPEPSAFILLGSALLVFLKYQVSRCRPRILPIVR